ncbi:MAG: EAL domain-containing protein [Wenzhouxiangella sp.]|nr:EAL domain-containing protein [Wenzhouxiangella sp.]MCH8478429.1 EAL domain-containing protein [Wenzhouxiangella sp.]TVR97176.1 MAG: EAL domain-containing protein [Wenzhouxiangellaceae bacterium]
MPTDNPTAVRLLIVEDSEADYLLIQRQLRTEGMVFESLRVDHFDAVDKALEQPWDVILYDYEIPGLDFDDALPLIKSRATDTPIILVSGTVDERMAAGLLRQGLDDFVLKDKLLRLSTAIDRVRRERLERSGRLAAEAELRKLAMVVEQSPASILITDTRPAIEYVNDAFVQNTGYEPEEVIGRNPSVLNTGNTPASTYRALWSALNQGQTWRGEFYNTRKDGSVYVEAAVVAPIRQVDGSISHYVAIKDDITAQRESEALIHRLAFYDQLTGLANRSLLMERLDQAMNKCRKAGQQGAVLMLDIDSFRFINDIHGYDIGDHVLREFGRRLQRELADTDTVARIGGNHFAVIVERLGATEAEVTDRIKQLTTRLHERVQQPCNLPDGSGQLRHATSMGICLFDGHEEGPETPLNRAELALQKAKDDGRNMARQFSHELKVQVEERALMEARLRSAVINRELDMHLQSQFDIEGRLLGAELLLRWPQADGSFISPMVFIPLAEVTGLILPIGQQVFDQAIKLLQDWQSKPATRSLQLSINVSARQFHQPDFVDQLRTRLQKSTIDGSRLVLELTESVVLDEFGSTGEKMRAIRELGVGIALDDFGKGYSSLSYLKHLPFDVLKIDRSFIADMLASPSSEAIVRAILAMGHALKMHIIAEGVENEAQWDLLRRERCAGYQGYLFARPVGMDQWQPGDFSANGSPSAQVNRKE